MRTRPAARAARLLSAPLRRGLELLEDRTTPALTLGISPAAVWEYSGVGAATGTVTRDGDLSQALTVNLSSNDATEATVPASVVIPAGAASATFPVNAVDDSITDGTQTATITASATAIARALHNGLEQSVGRRVETGDEVGGKSARQKDGGERCRGLRHTARDGRELLRARFATRHLERLDLGRIRQVGAGDARDRRHVVADQRGAQRTLLLRVALCREIAG